MREERIAATENRDVEKECWNCKYVDDDDKAYPCSACKFTVESNDPEYEKRELLWRHVLDEENNAVQHPKHYNHGKYECIDVMVENFGKEAVKHFCLLNAFKYVWRSDYKNGTQDIKKAMWYLDKYVELEGENCE